MAAPTSSISSDKDLAEFLTEHILDESLDPVQTAILLSLAKNRVETNEKPEFLQDEDVSQIRSSGDSYLTMKSLPDNFRQMIALYVGNIPYTQVPFKKRHTYRNSSFKYYIDHKNAQFAICGSAGASETIRQEYLIKTDDFTDTSVVDDNATTCVWPKEHWPLIAWEVAEIVTSGTDVGVDDVSYKMSAAHKEQHERSLHMFRNWDHDLKLQSIDGRAGYADDGDNEDLVGEILPHM